MTTGKGCFPFLTGLLVLLIVVALLASHII